MIETVLADTKVDLGGERIAVVGGGIVGCVVALRLAAAGHNVSLFEAAPILGGLAAPWELGTLTWDRHYHVICESDSNLRALLRELDLDEEVMWSSVRTGFFSKSRFHDFTSIKDFLRFPPLRLYEKLRLGAAIVYASRANPASLRNITATKWLTRLCGRRVYTEIWEPLLRAKLGANAAKVSASFIAVTIRRLFGARTNNNGAERFGSVAGGYARIFDALQQKLARTKVNIRTSTPIERIETIGSDVIVHLATGSEHFDKVVVTVPAPRIPSLIPQLSSTEIEQLRTIPYAGVVCASLLLNSALSPYYITNITDRWVPFSAIIEFSNVIGTLPFGGKSLIYLPKYVAPNDPLFEQDDETIRNSFVSAIIRMIPAFDPSTIAAFRVSRVRDVFPFPIASAPHDPPTFKTSIAGITIATAAQIDDATLNVDRSVALANDAAMHVLKGSPR